MAVMKIWAGSPLTALPSPVSLKPSHEIIWSEDTGRAQSGENKAKMIGSVVDTKITYEIKWGIISASDLQTIKSYLHSGFFYFGVGETAPSSPKKFYRSNIVYEVLQVGSSVYYKDVQVSVIEQ